MKRLLSLAAAIALLLGLFTIPALAEDKLKVSLIKEVAFNDQVIQAPVMMVTNQGTGPVDVTVSVYDEAAKVTLQTLQFSLNAGDAPYSVMGYVYKPLQQNGQINTYRYEVTTAGGYRRNYYAAQIMHIDRQTNLISYTHRENPVYPRNTVTSFGPQFRIVKPDLTDEWYMFTPIDLSIQGRQTFELIGGNVRVVGEVYVDVYGDMVNVTYSYFYDGQTNKIERISDYLNFFPSFITVTTVDPENLPSQFTFGQPFSIERDLGNDTNVLMFVRNVETFYRYPVPTAELRRLYPNLAEYKALRQQMLDLMDKVEGLDYSNQHNWAN